MKRYTGIGLLIILNLIFTYLIIWGAILSYGIIVKPGSDMEVTNSVTREVLTKLFFISLILLSINYLVFKKMVLSKKPFIISFVIVLGAVLIFVPFFISARQSLIDFQQENARKRSHAN